MKVEENKILTKNFGTLIACFHIENEKIIVASVVNNSDHEVNFCYIIQLIIDNLVKIHGYPIEFHQKRNEINLKSIL